MKFLSSRRRSGFTLIELAIAMMVAGLMLASASSALLTHTLNKQRMATRNNLAGAQAALQSYYVMNGHYPCPASRMAGRGDPAFGKAAPVCALKSDPAKISTDGAAATGVATAFGREGRTVSIGLLPFRSLGLSDEQGTDGWKNILQYAVTDALTMPDSFDQMAGALDILADDGQSRLAPPASAQYIVISSGQSQAGGYAADGVRLSACPEGVLEAENCDDDAIFMDSITQYTDRGRDNIVNFDDAVAYEQYNPDIDARGGLLFFYRGSCHKGFTALDIGTRVPNKVETLSHYPSFDPAYRARVRGQKKILCFTPRFAATMSMKIDERHAGLACPQGWTGVGYRIVGTRDERDESGLDEYLEEANYQVCAR